MFNRKRGYFVAWVAYDNGRVYNGNNYMESELKGLELIESMVKVLQKNEPNGIITSITRVK